MWGSMQAEGMQVCNKRLASHAEPYIKGGFPSPSEAVSNGHLSSMLYICTLTDSLWYTRIKPHIAIRKT